MHFSVSFSLFPSFCMHTPSLYLLTFSPVTVEPIPPKPLLSDQIPTNFNSTLAFPFHHTNENPNQPPHARRQLSSLTAGYRTFRSTSGDASKVSCSIWYLYTTFLISICVSIFEVVSIVRVFTEFRFVVKLLN